MITAIIKEVTITKIIMEMANNNGYNNNLGGYNNQNNNYGNNGYNNPNNNYYGNNGYNNPNNNYYGNNGYNNGPYMMNNHYNNQEEYYNIFWKIKKTAKSILWLYLVFFIAFFIMLLSYVFIMVPIISNPEEASLKSSVLIGIALIAISSLLLMGIGIAIFVLEIMLTVRVSGAEGKHPEFRNTSTHTVLLIIGIILFWPCVVIDCFILNSKCNRVLENSTYLA